MPNFKLKQTSEQVQKAIDNSLNPDKTLNEEGVPADAQAVGEELKNKYSAENEPPYPVESVCGKTGAVSLTAGDVGADPRGRATEMVEAHNISGAAHNDIRLLISGLTTRLNALADSDDTTLDQLSEIVEYIKANKSLIDSITTSKVSVADIIDNLTTSVSNKPLSAKMGVELRRLISVVENRANNAMSDAADAMNRASYAESMASAAMNHASSAEQMASAAQTEIKKLKENGIGGGITEETDPTVPAWSKEPEKPKYTASEVGARPSTWTPSAEDVGADASGTADSKVTAHNTSDESHNDIRLLITGLTTRLNALANSTDEELDQLAEIVAYTKANKSLIDSITTSKVSVVDIIDNLTTSVSNKPLSAKMGVELKKLIDAIEIPTSLPASDVQNWAKQPTKPTYTKSEVGLGNVDNVRQYSASNQPPYPVTSVNGQTGAVTVTADGIGAATTGKVKELTEAIADKLPKNQGAANVGKILVVGTDGNLTLTDMPEGGASGDVTGVLDDSKNILLEGNLADGNYTLKWKVVDENGEVSYVDAGALEVSSIVTYTVTQNLTNATSDNSATAARKGESITVNLTANDGYNLKSITVTMGGTDITSTAVSGSKVTIASVTGDVVITAVAEEIKVIEPVTVDIALTDGLRLGSDGTDRTQAGYCATEDINLSNIPKPCTIQLTKAKWLVFDGDKDTKIRVYAKKANGTKLISDVIKESVGGSYFTVVDNSDIGNDVVVTVTSNDVGYIRFSGQWSYTGASDSNTSFAAANTKATLTYTPVS